MADEIIIDDYTLITHIASGGSTQVWEVADRTSGEKRYAMKLMLPEAFSNAEQKAVLKHEAKVLQRLEHPNLVRFHKLVVNKQRAYLVMEYFRAPNLKTQLQSDISSVRVRFGRLVEQICTVLGFLHDKGWVHRDIKPDNILFNKASELRLIDFSLTTRAAGAVAKMIGGKEKAIQGTRSYISPETILKAPPSPQADIYSLGVTLFEVLAGEPPFRGSSPDDLLKKHLISAPPEPSAFNKNVTPEMDRFILKMLSKRTKDRHKNMQELLVEFRNIKPFKEDSLEHERRMKADEAERYKSTLDKAGRLDSRADHLKQQLNKLDPEFAKEQAAQNKKAAVAQAAKSAPAAKASPAKPAAPPASRAPAPPPSMPAPPPAAQQAPMMPSAYPAGPGPAPYGYPGYGQYPIPGYPATAQAPGGYPPNGYPANAYPAGGYPPGAYPQGAYPQGAYPPGAYPGNPYQGSPYPGGAYPPGGFPPQGYSTSPYPSTGYPPNAFLPNAYPPNAYPQGGYAPAGAPQQTPPQQTPPQQMPPQMQPAQAPYSATQPQTAAPGFSDQQNLLQQFLGQPQAANSVPAPAPVVATQGAATQGASRQAPASRGANPELPLMDQLPPVK